MSFANNSFLTLSRKDRLLETTKTLIFGMEYTLKDGYILLAAKYLLIIVATLIRLLYVQIEKLYYCFLEALELILKI